MLIDCLILLLFEIILVYEIKYKYFNKKSNNSFNMFQFYTCITLCTERYYNFRSLVSLAYNISYEANDKIFYCCKK